MKDVEKVKRLVRKLLALSKSDNENEAETALRKAGELMEAYGLEEGEAKLESVKVKAVRRHVPWRSIIANAVSHLYCCYWYSDNGDFVFNGESLDVFMASEMYGYLARTIERTAKKEIRKNAKYYFRHDFKQGMAGRLYDRIMELGKQCSWRNEREAKIEYVKEVVKKRVETEEATWKKRTVNQAAFSRGALYAGGVSLARQAGYEPPARIAPPSQTAQGELF
jgi:hypothetical protein